MYYRFDKFWLNKTLAAVQFEEKKVSGSTKKKKKESDAEWIKYLINIWQLHVMLTAEMSTV